MHSAINSTDTLHEITRVAGNQAANVWYDGDHDTVALEVGSTTIHMATTHFFAMHEMIRKAVARLAMQTPLDDLAVKNELEMV